MTARCFPSADGEFKLQTLSLIRVPTLAKPKDLINATSLSDRTSSVEILVSQLKEILIKVFNLFDQAVENFAMEVFYYQKFKSSNYENSFIELLSKNLS